MEPTAKKCGKCKEIKFAAAFASDAKRKTGLCSSCRECTHANYLANCEKIKARARAIRHENKDAISDRNKARRKDDPNYRALRHAYNKKWSDQNKDVKAQTGRNYREKNLATLKACKKRKYWACPEKHRAKSKESSALARAELLPRYVHHVLRHSGKLSQQVIDANPDFVQAYTAQIKTRRLIINLKKTNTPTPTTI